MGVGAGSQGTFTMAGGTVTPSNLMCAGCRVGSTGTVWVTGGQLTSANQSIEIGADGRVGQMTVSNGTVLAQGITVGLFATDSAKGTLTVAGGSVQTVNNLVAGWEQTTTGTVWVTGGQLNVSGNTVLGVSPEKSFGSITISNGTVTANAANIGNSHGLSGTLALYGGAMAVYSNMTVGYCPVNTTGSVLIAGGALYVSNSTSTAALDLSSGTLTLSSGLLYVDTFVVTNTCARFVFAAPPPTATLLYSQSILSSNLDADGDGLTNYWEAKYGLGPLNPWGNDGGSGDPDGDGLTNLQEQGLGMSPIDYYNGNLPSVSITNGDNQSGLTNTFLPIPLTVQVTVTPVSGAWVTNAPVLYTVTQGGGQLATSTNGAPLSSSLQVRTGTNRQASAFLYLPATAGTNLVDVAAISGTSTVKVTFTETSIVQTVAAAPTVTTNPTNLTVCAGSLASFSAAASGSPTIFSTRWRGSSEP